MSEKEFDQQVMIFSNKFYGYSFRILGNKDDAKDVIQDLYCKLWSIRTSLKSVRNIEAYATTILRNLCIDRIRRNRKVSMNSSNTISLENIQEDSEDNLTSDWELKLNRVRVALSNLSDVQQKVFIMRDIEEMEFSEIADLLLVNHENVRVILSRARQKIRELLNGK